MLQQNAAKTGLFDQKTKGGKAQYTAQGQTECIYTVVCKCVAMFA